MKKAGKILALLLALCMVFALAACADNSSSGNGGSESSSPPSGSDNSANADNGGTSGPGGPKELGFYDRDYDYTQHEAYRMAYLVSGPGVMYDSFDTAFETWCERLNMNYGGMWAPAEASNEAFLSGLENYADMGYDGLIIDADPNLCARIAEICTDNDILWMMGMSQARDYSQKYTIFGEYSDGPLYCPNVGFNDNAVGRECAEGLMQWKENTYPDVPWEQVGFISVTYSGVPQINARTLGNKQAWAEKNPSFGEYDPDPTSELKNFMIADTASGTFDQQTATNLVTQIMSNPPGDIQVWLVSAAVWDFAAGAAVVAENMNMVDKVCVTTFGSGASAIALWDSGEPTPIKISLETASPVYAEAIINGLWAMLAGFAAPDTLWPEWAIIWDKGDRYQLSSELDPVYQVPVVETGDDGKPIVLEEHNYASMILPMIWVNPENYKEFYGWVDLYDLGSDASEEERNYPDYPLGTDINAFVARAEIPDYYREYPNAD